MGKIFDALEKAQRDYSKTSPVSGKDARHRKNSVAEDKIVPFAHTNKMNNERKLDVNLVTYHSPQSVEAELFKVLRTNLLFPSKGPAPKTILITSPIPGDGKSLVSSNLAISVARGVEEYVLLLDCDIRRPSIHTMFGYGQVNGISEYLVQGKDLTNYLLKTPIPKLSLLPGGTPPVNPTELLTSKRMKALIDEVAGRYDDRFIIIDSPPPAMATETSALAKLVDGVMIVVKHGKTPRQALTELVDQIGKEKVLGFVLNFSEQSLKKYYGYGKSYYRADEKKRTNA